VYKDSEVKKYKSERIIYLKKLADVNVLTPEEYFNLTSGKTVLFNEDRATKEREGSNKASWESEKIHKQKIEKLKDVVKAKDKELEKTSSSLSSLRETLMRSERDRSRLQLKLQKLESKEGKTAKLSSEVYLYIT
jgi:predicted RNase H-like nuclease (RuvC/YqgF family)